MAQDQQQPVELTPEVALNTIMGVCDNYRGTRKDHDIFAACREVLVGVIVAARESGSVTASDKQPAGAVVPFKPKATQETQEV